MEVVEDVSVEDTDPVPSRVPTDFVTEYLRSPPGCSFPRVGVHWCTCGTQGRVMTEPLRAILSFFPKSMSSEEAEADRMDQL